MSLRAYGGNGYSGCKEIGNYEVQGNEGDKLFTNFSKAKAYYESLNCEKAFWDVDRYELLDAFYEDDDMASLNIK